MSVQELISTSSFLCNSLRKKALKVINPLNPSKVCQKHGHLIIEKAVVFRKRGGINYWDVFSDWIAKKRYCKTCLKNYNKLYNAKPFKYYSACLLTKKQEKDIEIKGYTEIFTSKKIDTYEQKTFN